MSPSEICPRQSRKKSGASLIIMEGQCSAHTLQTTALVNQAYLRLVVMALAPAPKVILLLPLILFKSA
jgi:hypothetical protein